MNDNPERLVAKRLIKALASEVNLKPKSILALHALCRASYLPYNSAACFAAVLQSTLAKDSRRQVVRFLNDKEDLPMTYHDLEALLAFPPHPHFAFAYDMISICYHHGGYGDPKAPAPSYGYPDRELPVVKEKLVKKKVIAKEVPVAEFVPEVLRVVQEPTLAEVAEFGATNAPLPVVHDVPTKWEPQQVEALSMIYKWLRLGPERKQIFRLFGYAGTGKTTLARQVSNFVMNEMGKGGVPYGGVLFAAYTGKAASVLRRKGCYNAQTLHSLLYKPVIDEATGKCTGFTINTESPLSQAALLVVDEASMINEEMGIDILSFGKPVLVLGDPAQLPPVKGEGYFTVDAPDYLLTDIRRQAKDNPIIYLATLVREGNQLKPGQYGESVVYAYGHHVSDELFSSADKIIVGLNNTRKTCNIRARRLNGRFAKDPVFPVKGDSLICTRNNQDKTLFNGTMWTCTQPVLQPIMQPVFKGSTVRRQGHVDVLAFKVRSEDEMDSEGRLLIFETQCSPHHFDPSMAEPAWKSIAGSDSFEYGYGITAHKSQGSQWDSILLFDESNVFREDRYKHLYTSITRAAVRIAIQQ